MLKIGELFPIEWCKATPLMTVVFMKGILLVLSFCGRTAILMANDASGNLSVKTFTFFKFALLVLSGFLALLRDVFVLIFFAFLIRQCTEIALFLD